MKLKEKLAEDYVKDQKVPQNMDTYIPHEDSYLAGFEKCREMARKIIKDWDTTWYEEDLKLEAQRHHREIQISELGEEEV